MFPFSYTKGNSFHDALFSSLVERHCGSSSSNRGLLLKERIGPKEELTHFEKGGKKRNRRIAFSESIP